MPDWIQAITLWLGIVTAGSCLFALIRRFRDLRLTSRRDERMQEFDLLLRMSAGAGTDVEVKMKSEERRILSDLTEEVLLDDGESERSD